MPTRFDFGERPAAEGAEAGDAFLLLIDTRGVSIRAETVKGPDFEVIVCSEYWAYLVGLRLSSSSVRLRFAADFMADGATFSASEPSEAT